MTAREQFSWVWLAILLVTYIPFFALVIAQRGGPEPSGLAQVWLLAWATITQIVLIAIASVVIRLRTGNPDDLDERDRAIAHRAATRAYFVLMAGFIVVGCVMPFSDSGWQLVHATVFCIAVSEIVRLVLVVRAYRLGVHG